MLIVDRLRKPLLLLALLLCLFSCGDKTFEELPIVNLSGEKINMERVLKDSVPIQNGLFYRQLIERDYHAIYGHARLIPAPSKRSPMNYELVVLSTQKGAEVTKLICSIAPIYHKIIEVTTYHPSKYRMISLQTSSMSATFTDIKLLDISRITSRPDTLLIQVDPDGRMDEIPLCCEF